MKQLIRRCGVILAAGVLASTGLAVIATVPAVACDQFDNSDCGDSDNSDTPSSTDSLSSGTVKEPYKSPGKSCSVYANGAGMGMYCASGGSGLSKTLREMFGSQKLQRCRYSEIPPTIQKPYNANPDKGRFMIMTCLDNIDFDTHAGGPDRTVDITLVFVPNGTDTEDRHNEITEFLWGSVANKDTLMPIPFMRTRPNTTPLVGIPTYFTFRWLDPATTNVVAEGPYANTPDGGAYREITQNGVTMQARATKIVIDPNQEGIDSVTCDPSTPYLEGRPPKEQPANACSIVFPRSSASARKLATKDIPSHINDAFYADVRVTWEITYGEPGGDMDRLGNDFTMQMRQVIPVQEVQAPNQPPAVIY